VRHGPAVLIGLIVQLAAAPALADRATVSRPGERRAARTCQNVTGLTTVIPLTRRVHHSANPQTTHI